MRFAELGVLFLLGLLVLLFVARPLGLLILAAAFTGMLLFDGRASRIGEAPLWYRRLRLPLTGVVVAALVVGAAG